MISSGMGWLANPIFLDCKGPHILECPQGSTPVIITAQLDTHKEL